MRRIAGQSQKRIANQRAEKAGVYGCDTDDFADTEEDMPFLSLDGLPDTNENRRRMGWGKGRKFYDAKEKL